ncbi:DinB family protein [Luteipulveratus sp. YIM 133132]|uniref:DinB family protein n=1 Tax=Luteipulveratus flavus TaxID=3031728 RepID=UPI0023B03258|nr:DinB family protein [Luteipulveratus sp. YIM 133132]MDE9367303.1 DinB family protein [Luteipulveratus sp. YIM 133132]
MTTERKYPDMWADPEDDPRDQSSTTGERQTLLGYLEFYRLTLKMKCDGLNAEQLARRSVPPSTMSLLGLIRHLARVEHHWFVRVMQQQQVDRIYWSADDGDLDFNGVVADDEVVSRAWADWEAQVAAAEAYVESAASFDVAVPLGEETVELRDVLVHMIEEYARHCGHADLLRECIDGRTGQ